MHTEPVVTLIHMLLAWYVHYRLWIHTRRKWSVTTKRGQYCSCTTVKNREEDNNMNVVFQQDNYDVTFLADRDGEVMKLTFGRKGKVANCIQAWRLLPPVEEYLNKLWMGNCAQWQIKIDIDYIDFHTMSEESLTNSRTQVEIWTNNLPITSQLRARTDCVNLGLRIF